jgi:hypothetical protein
VARRVLSRAARASALVVLFAAALSGCSAGDPRACTVTCGAAGECPDGTSCGPDQYCYAADQQPGSCAQGSGDDDGTSDAGEDGQDSGDDGSDDGQSDAGDGADCEPCDPVEQCGCGEESGCYVSTSDPEPYCWPEGDEADDSQCGGNEDCAAGYFCFKKPALGDPGHCQRFCDDDEDCSGGVSLCNRAIEGTEFRTCTSDCNPLDVKSCGPFEKCTLSQGIDGRWDARCLEHGTGEELFTCSDPYFCGPGLHCTGDAVEEGFCRALCIVGEPCAIMDTCSGFDPPVVLAGVEYGTCPF